MAQTSTIEPKQPRGLRQSLRIDQLAAPLPTPAKRARKHDRLMVWAEIAAIAVLMLGFLGTTLAGGPTTVLNALFASPNDASGPTALYRGDAARTGVMPEAGPAELPSVIWRKQLTNPNLWPVLATSSRIYMVDDEGGSIQSVSTTSGMPIWEATVGKMRGLESIAVANGFVYVSTAGQLQGGSDQGYLIALDESNGQERWRYETGGSLTTSPAVEDGFVYVLALDNSLRVVDAMTGIEAWRYDIASGTPSMSAMATAIASGTPEASISNSYGYISQFSPAIANGMIYVTANDGVLYAVDLKSHQEAWQFASDGNILSTPAVVNGVIYLPGWGATDYEDVKNSAAVDPPDGRLYAINATTGDEIWTWTGADFVDIVAANQDNIYLTNDGTMTELSASDGTSTWTVDAGFDAPVFADGIIYLLDQKGTINAYAASDGTLIWQAYTAGRMPLTTNGMLVMKDAKNQLVKLGPADVATPGAVISPNASPVTDLSDLPACTAPDPKPSVDFDGTPTASLVPIRDGQDQGQPAQVLLSEIPEGTPVSAQVEGEIVQTLRQTAACLPAGRAESLSGFFSDDFFRREWIQAYLKLNPDSLGRLLPQTTTYDDLQLLPDGRVGMLTMYNDQHGWFYIFSKEDNRWVVDEWLEVVPELGGMG